jgi:hypothetical protein
MRARIIFIILLVLILIFTLWPTVISMGAEWYGRWHGCEVEFTRAIPCIINGEDWGQSIYQTQQWAYLSLFTIPWGMGLLAIWAAALLIYLVVHFIRRGRKPQSS